MFLTAPTSLFHTRAALFLALAMAFVVGSALAFEHIGGYIPCKLCLEQRWPYYLGAPIMALAALSASKQAPATRSLLIIGGALMAYGFYTAVNHAGIEWAFWPGPADCAAVELEYRNRRRQPPECHKQNASSLVRQGGAARFGPFHGRMERHCQRGFDVRCCSRGSAALKRRQGSSSTSQYR